MILMGVGVFIKSARVLDALSFIFWVTFVSRPFVTAKKMTGKTSALLIWFGKSLLPLATIAAPAFSASFGIISGIGFAIAKTIAFFAILFTISLVIRFGPETPITASAPFITFDNDPRSFSLFEIPEIACL